MPAKLDLSGHKYGKLRVASPASQDKQGQTKWICQCDCGSEVVVRTNDMRTGKTTSCGCHRSSVSTKKATKHGLRFTREYRIWCNMKSRCTNPAFHKYPIYGGRGISICQEWLGSFQNFFDDMGLCPTPQHSIDRIDVDGNYEPSNCRWATPKQQTQNRRINKCAA